MLPLTTLFTVATSDQMYARMIALIVSLGVPADKWRQGGPLSVIVRICAILYAGFTQMLATVAASCFLETASGAGLTLLARNMYNVERRLATQAREKLTLTNSSSNVFDDNVVGSVIAFNPITNKFYQNDEEFSLDASQTLDVYFIAVEAGSDSTSAAGTITALQTQLSGVTCSNANAFVGIDDELDADLRSACLFKLGSLSVRGPRTAYQWAVRIATLSDGVTPVNVNRSSVSTSDSQGRVFIWLASPSGAPTSDDINGVAASVEASARPDTVRVTTQACTVVPIVRTIDVWVKQQPGVTASDIESKIETAFVQQGATYPIGGIKKDPSTQGYVYAGWVDGVCKEAWTAVYDVDGFGDDVVLDDGQVANLQITANVHLQAVSST